MTQGGARRCGGGGVDALLLLSACADVQQKEEEEDPAPQKPPGLEVVAEQGMDIARDPNLRHHPQRPRRRVASYGLPLGHGFNGLCRPLLLAARQAKGQSGGRHDRMPSVDHGHDGSVPQG